MTEPLTLLPLLPEILLALAITVMLPAGTFLQGNAGGVMRATALVVLLLTAALVLWGGGAPQQAFDGLFVSNGFTLYVKLLLLGAAAAALMAGGDYARRLMDQFEYPILVCFAVLGMMIMVSAGNLMSMYMGLELQSLSLYVMAALRRDSLRSTEAGLKYFVLGALSSGLLLYGCSLIYGYTGSLDFTVLSGLLAGEGPAPAGVAVGLMFLLAALAFKLSAAPFHMWTPDVYEGAPTPVVAFFAAAPKLAAMALLMRLLTGPFLEMIEDWRQPVMLLAVLSMLLGAFAAILQNNLKRLMAYSAIGHVGYALIGLAAGTPEAIQASLIYLTVYLFMTLGVFACILCMKVEGRMTEEISALAGLKSDRPLLAAVLMVLMFSMAGVPPLAGFIGKFTVFRAAVAADMTALAVVGALTSVVAAFYYLRIVKVMYFDEPAAPLDPVQGLGRKTVIAVTGVFCATFLLYAPLVSVPALTAARALFAG